MLGLVSHLHIRTLTRRVLPSLCSQPPRRRVTAVALRARLVSSSHFFLLYNEKMRFRQKNYTMQIVFFNCCRHLAGVFSLVRVPLRVLRCAFAVVGAGLALRFRRWLRWCSCLVLGFVWCGLGVVLPVCSRGLVLCSPRPLGAGKRALSTTAPLVCIRFRLLPPFVCSVSVARCPRWLVWRPPRLCVGFRPALVLAGRCWFASSPRGAANR